MTLDARRRRDQRRTRYARVWVNGTEVTERCYYVDGRRRLARCFVHVAPRICAVDASGEIVKEVLRGRIRVRISRERAS